MTEAAGDRPQDPGFRKWYATEIYKNNGYDITLVQKLFLHSSAAVTKIHRH